MTPTRYLIRRNKTTMVHRIYNAICYPRAESQQQRHQNNILNMFKVKPFRIYSRSVLLHSPVANYIFNVNNRNTRTRCEICLKLTIKIPERCQWCRVGVFIVNIEHISHFVLVFLLLTLGR